MSGSGIDYEFWKKVSAISTWEAAAMMYGCDPRAITAGEVVVNEYGDMPDLSDQEHIVNRALAAHEIAACPAGPQSAVRKTLVTAVSLIPWFRRLGYTELADGLTISTPSATGPVKWTPEFLDEVRAYRAKHNTKATAEKFGVSAAFIRKKLPRKQPTPGGHSVFNQGTKKP